MIFIADRGCTTGDQSRAVALQKTICFQVMACLLIPLYIVNSANSSLQSSSSFAILDKIFSHVGIRHYENQKETGAS